MPENAQPTPTPAEPKSRLALILLIPYALLLFPRLYARWTPEILGFPFFYWFQFALVIFTAILTAIVSRNRDRRNAKKAVQG